MQVNEGEDEAFDVLHKVEEDYQSFRVRCLLHVCKRTDFWSFQADFLFPDPNVYFLLSNLIWLWPVLVAFLHDATFYYYFPHLVNHCLWHEHFFADQWVTFILRIIEVLQLSSGIKFKVQVLVAIGTFVANVITEEELFSFVFHLRFIRVQWILYYF